MKGKVPPTAKKRTREASISLWVKRGNGEDFDVVERDGELGVGDEGRQLERQHVQRVHSQLAQREVHELMQLMRRERLSASAVRVNLRERRMGRKTFELSTNALRGSESAVSRPCSMPCGWM